MPSARQRLQMRVIVLEEDDATVPSKMLPRKRTQNMLRPVNFGTAKGWRSGETDSGIVNVNLRYAESRGTQLSESSHPENTNLSKLWSKKNCQADLRLLTYVLLQGMHAHNVNKSVVPPKDNLITQ
jgi:hypothetical protein